MTITFEDALRMYQADRVGELAASEEGFRFLLLKTLDRPDYERRIAVRAALDPKQISGRARLRSLFVSTLSIDDIKECIAEIYREEREVRRAREQALVAELYKMKSFDWGGLHQNSLEKTIVDQYIKKVRNFDSLNERIDNELLVSLRGYVQCSWYNHWTSILIEDIFKDQPGVIPAVGLVKKIDFFIADAPFDLKVTYLPEGFVKEQRKSKGLDAELSLLKRLAKKKNILIDVSLPEARLLEQLWSILADNPDPDARALVGELTQMRKELVQAIKAAPEALLRWLYENQGLRRFDSSNRLFLILINTKNYFDSWKLKRAHALLAKHVETFIADRRNRVGHEIEFEWEGKRHKATSDLLVIEHDT